MKDPAINDNQWWNLHEEFASYFDEMRAFELHDFRDKLFDFHYTLLTEDEVLYKEQYKHIVFTRDFERFSEKVHILELMATKIYWHKRIIDDKLRERNKNLDDKNPDVSILMNSLIEMMNDMSSKYIHREDLTKIQNRVNELIFRNRKELKLCVETIILFHSMNRDWKLISRFVSLVPHNYDNKKVYYLAMIHRAFLKSLDDFFYSILDILVKYLNSAVKKKHSAIERDDELNILFTLLTGYLKEPAEIRFFLKNRDLTEQFKRVVRRDINAFVFNENDEGFSLPQFFEPEDFPEI